MFAKTLSPFTRMHIKNSLQFLKNITIKMNNPHRDIILGIYFQMK